MKLNRINTLEEYNLLVDNFQKKGSVSNNYMMPKEVGSLLTTHSIGYISTEDNIAFIVQKPKCKRLYYIINDFNQLFNFEDYDYVVEILYRGESFYPQREIDYLQECGFVVNLIRNQYSSMYKDLVVDSVSDSISISVGKASTIEEVKYACELFNKTFDVYSGDFITEEDYSNLLDNHSIIIAKQNDTFLGALHQTIEKNTVWLSHIVVDENSRGMHVGNSLVNYWIELNKQTEKTRYMLWVQSQNTPAVKLYENKGFKYINKSTISLIKK